MHNKVKIKLYSKQNNKLSIKYKETQINIGEFSTSD